MAEPVYPSLEPQEGPQPIGFEGLGEPEGGQKSYAVQFTPSGEGEAEKLPTAATSSTEEIRLLERSKDSPTEEEEKKLKEQTVFFEDGVRRIDFILAYQDELPTKKTGMKACLVRVGILKSKEDTEERRRKRERKRNTFLESCEKIGLQFEKQNCDESPDHKTYFLKVHATHEALLHGAEDMLLRMPIKKNTLMQGTWREWFFDKIRVKDPFVPDVPEELKIENYFTAPFSYEHKDNFIDWEKDSFFSNAQRSAIVAHLFNEARYGEDPDQVGVLRLLTNGTFSTSYPLHESSYKVKKGEEIKTDRQFLYRRWSFWTNWFRNQPLNHVRKYFGEKVGIYFTWLGFYTSWLLPASVMGIIVMLYGLSTIPDAGNPPAEDICRDETRYWYYMCPVCDERCDFWYLRDTCGFAHVALLFDNGGTVFFAIFMSFWAVLFLEFWKRRQYKLQYDWDMLGYEAAVEDARPEFEQRIKKYISRSAEHKKARFRLYNPVLEKEEYIQPAHWFVPKVITGFSILIAMVAVVIAIVFAVLLYRLAVAGAIYRLVSGIAGGPSVSDIVVSISGACIQLVFIIIMNRVYEYLATVLNNWELHRTPSEYEDSFITKMYLFQFVNFYSSLFYIAFIKGNFVGYPGDYQRIGRLRLDECSSYGCLLELTIQLAIIMIGKQILNNCQELAIPYVLRLIKKCKHKEEEPDDVYTRWEKDFDLIPLSVHGLFYEYLELIIQYGFVTIFVAAFPLAPFFAMLNNWVEIRLDAHKFMAVFRRPVAERAQDIGAWFAILQVISFLSVITNAILIATTAQWVPFEVYVRGDFRDDYNNTQFDFDLKPLSGYVNWSLSDFPIEDLVDGRAFPAMNAQELVLYDDDGDEVTDDGEDLLYLPWIDFNCIERMSGDAATTFKEITMLGIRRNITTFTESNWENFYGEVDNRRLLFNNTGTVPGDNETPEEDSEGPCYKRDTEADPVKCRFRGLVDENGDRPLRYWQSWAARLAFIICFEHFIFIIAAFLAWLVPDVPQSVKNEIQKEKLLAYEAIHTRRKEGDEDLFLGQSSPSHQAAEGIGEP